MAFWSKFFKKKKDKEYQEDDWEKLVYDRASVDFGDEVQRTRYISECLEQIADATKEIDLLTGEYSLVTSYLKDMEEIEALPEAEKKNLENTARRLLTLEQECQRYREKKNRMKDSDYYRIRSQEREVLEGINKLRESEDYGKLIRQDLKRLDRERHAYVYRRSELNTSMDNYRGMAVIFLTAFVACMGLMAILQFGFSMDTRIGYLSAVAAVAIAVTILMVKYTDRDRELQRVQGAINKLIQLQNKVKIRYVNNNNLQDYLRMKYGVDSARTLETRWKQYQQEKEERKEFAEAEAKQDFYKKELMAKLTNYQLADPGRWADRPGAILDNKEMVEIRHELILRRQALRKQMDYNTGVAEAAKNEITDIARTYPAYASEISAMVDRYE